MASGAFEVASVSYAPATYHGRSVKPKSCTRSNPAKKGFGPAFENVWDGKCYSCPEGCTRNLDSKYSGKQCSCPPRVETDYARAAKHEKAKFLKCPKGEFLHTFNGTCYSCPKGFTRSTKKISGSKACLKRRTVKASTESWVLRDDKVRRCPKFAIKGTMKECTPPGANCVNVFYDPRKHGQCWSCPNFYDRSVSAVTDAKACIQE